MISSELVKTINVMEIGAIVCKPLLYRDLAAV